MTINVNVTHGVDQCLLRLIGEGVCSLKSIAASLDSLAADVKLIRQKYSGILPSEATGIKVVQDPV